MEKKIEIRKDGTRRVVSFCKGKSMTQQQFKNECDHRTILDRHRRTGQLRVNKLYESGTYGDFSNPTDYQTAQNIIIQAQMQFDGLPSDVRKSFDNDPQNFLEFCSNPENEAKMIEMGLKASPEAQKAPSNVEDVPSKENKGDESKTSEGAPNSSPSAE